MKPDRGIIVAYSQSQKHDMFLLHMRHGVPKPKEGKIWARSLSEADYCLLDITRAGESVEEVIISLNGEFLYCRTVRHERNASFDSGLAVYSFADRRVVSRLQETDIAKCHTTLTKSFIMRLVQGDNSERVIRCIVQFRGEEGGAEESWIVKVDFGSSTTLLESKLPGLFW